MGLGEWDGLWGVEMDAWGEGRLGMNVDEGGGEVLSTGDGLVSSQPIQMGGEGVNTLNMDLNMEMRGDKKQGKGSCHSWDSSSSMRTVLATRLGVLPLVPWGALVVAMVTLFLRLHSLGL